MLVEQRQGLSYSRDELNGSARPNRMLWFVHRILWPCQSRMGSDPIGQQNRVICSPSYGSADADVRYSAHCGLNSDIASTSDLCHNETSTAYSITSSAVATATWRGGSRRIFEEQKRPGENPAVPIVIRLFSSVRPIELVLQSRKDCLLEWMDVQARRNAVER